MWLCCAAQLEAVRQIRMPFLDVRSATASYEAYTSAVGRAMAVCQNFEACAHHVMVVWEITHSDNRELGFEELRSIALALRNVTLGGATRTLARAGDLGANHAELFERGRAARNWLAHESTLRIDEKGSLRDDFVSHLTQFRLHIRYLCQVDAVLAGASYEIQEREAVRPETLDSYARGLEAWVLEPIGPWLESA